MMTAVQLLPILVIGLPILCLWIYSIIWAVGDANRRNKPGWLVGLLVFLVHPWPLGLVLWLLFRPDEQRWSY